MLSGKLLPFILTLLLSLKSAFPVKDLLIVPPLLGLSHSQEIAASMSHPHEVSACKHSSHKKVFGI